MYVLGAGWEANNQFTEIDASEKAFEIAHLKGFANTGQ